MSQFEYKEFYSRNLPHIQPPEATFFVTFRLDRSIPETVLERWRIEAQNLEATLARWATTSAEESFPDPLGVAEERLKFHRRWFQKFEDLLHKEETGPLWLKDDRLAKIVADAIHYLDNKEYRLDAYCVMPNHVHMVFSPYLTEKIASELADQQIKRRKKDSFDQQTPTRFVLSSIMRSLKGYTARKCNQSLNRQGAFWQHESFDHIIRNRAEWERIVEYVLENPVKAGLVRLSGEWKWNYHAEDSTIALQ